MKVKIPHEIYVGAHKYKIFFNPMVKAAGDAAVGHLEQEIWLDPERGNSQLSVSYVHEIFHIINRCFFDYKFCEADVSLFAEAFAPVLVRELGIEFDFSSIPTIERKDK